MISGKERLQVRSDKSRRPFHEVKAPSGVRLRDGPRTIPKSFHRAGFGSTFCGSKGGLNIVLSTLCLSGVSRSLRGERRSASEFVASLRMPEATDRAAHGAANRDTLSIIIPYYSIDIAIQCRQYAAAPCGGLQLVSHSCRSSAAGEQHYLHVFFRANGIIMYLRLNEPREP